MRLLEELVGVSSANSEYDWAGTTHTQLMIPTDTKISSNVVFDDRIEKTGNAVFSLIVPKSYEYTAVIDGTATINLKFGVHIYDEHYGDDEATLHNVEMKITIVDSEGNEKTVVDYFDLWSGNLTHVYVTGDSPPSTMSIITWLNLSDISISGNERLKWYFRYTATSSNSSDYTASDPYVYLYTDKDAEDLLIQLPFVMG